MAALSQWEPCPTSTHFIAPPSAAFAFVQIEFLPRILKKIHKTNAITYIEEASSSINYRCALQSQALIDVFEI